MERPSVMTAYSASWTEAVEVLRSRPRFYWWWIVAAAIVGALTLLVPDSIMETKEGQPTIAAAIPFCLVAWELMIGVLAYFVLADTVRRIVPSFKMTVPVFFLGLGINLVYGWAVQIAMYVFIIPAFYIAPKLWLWYPYYLLYGVERSEFSETFVRSWRDTTGLYWPTFGLMALIVFVELALLVVVLAGTMLPIQAFHPLAIITLPIMVGATIFVVAQVNYAWLAWAAAVRQYSDALAAAAVPAAGPAVS